MNTQLCYDVNQLIIERHLFHAEERILISISGGQDSILLCSVLYRLRLYWNWYLGVVHCDHQWSDKSINQARQMYRLSATLQVIFYLAIPVLSVRNEATARHWRYVIMRRIAKSHSYSAITLGHTSSDRVETLLAHCFRGTGFDGIEALRWKRPLRSEVLLKMHSSKQTLGIVWHDINFVWKKKTLEVSIYSSITKTLKVVRPLLNLARDEVHVHVKKWGLPTCSDNSNYDLRLRRNRIRCQLLPYLRLYFNPRIDYALNTLAEIAHFELVYVHNLIESLCLEYVDIKHTGLVQIIGIPLEFWRSLPIGIQRRMLKYILASDLESSFSFEQIEHIRLAVIQNLTKPNQVMTFSSTLHISIVNHVKAKSFS